MQAPREGSRKASVFTAFIESGERAAYKIAAELELKAGTVKSWIGSWSKGGPAKPVKVSTAAQPKTAFKGENAKLTWSKRPVRLVGWGPEQCEIKFLDTGTCQGVVTSEVLTLEGKPYAKQA